RACAFRSRLSFRSPCLQPVRPRCGGRWRRRQWWPPRRLRPTGRLRRGPRAIRRECKGRATVLKGGKVGPLERVSEKQGVYAVAQRVKQQNVDFLNAHGAIVRHTQVDIGFVQDFVQLAPTLAAKGN